MSVANPTKALLCAVVASVSGVTPTASRAERQSLQDTRLDPAPPVRAGSFSFNVAGIVFSRYSTEIEVTLTASASVFGEVSYVRANGDALDLHLGARWYLASEGIHGFFLGLAFGVAEVLLRAAPFPSARTTAGYVFAIDGFLLALEAGARGLLVTDPSATRDVHRFAPEFYLRVAAGYTWW